MENAQMLESLCQKVIQGDMGQIDKLCAEALASGLDPLEILEQGLSKGMDIVGHRFQTGEAYLPELLMAADVFSKAMETVTPALEAEQKNVKKAGKVLLATVKGDVHDLGKNIVATVLATNGFEVIDIGVDQDTLTIIEEAQKHKVDVIGLSAVMTTTMPHQRELIATLTELNIRDQFIVLVGGGPVNAEWAEEIGADGYGKTAMDAVSVAKQGINQKSVAA